MVFVGFKAEFAWTLTRDPNPETKYLNACDQMLDDNGFDLDKFNVTRQDQVLTC